MKWIAFKYSGKEVRQITKLFEDTNLKTLFCTHNTIEVIIKPTPQI
jgi:hypothetical protein